MKNFARDIVFITFAFVLIGWGVMFRGADVWWVSTAFIFAPRWLLAVPLVIAFPLTLALRPVWAPAYVVHAAIIVFPVMNYQLAKEAKLTGPHQAQLRVIAYNVGGGDVFAEALVRMVKERDCDLVLLQECPPGLAAKVFEELDWFVQQHGLMSIASRYQLGDMEVLERHYPNEHNAMAVACSLTIESKRYQVINVHLPTPRPGLADLWNNGPDGIQSLQEVIAYRSEVSAKVAAKIDEFDEVILVGGDFNMPVESRIYARDWGEFHNAFSAVGTGFGYTKCTRWHGVRIDHVLCSTPWIPVRVDVGESLGGDHRPVFSELVCCGE